MINVIPVNDSEKHEENSTCHCNPTVEFHDGEMIIIHNAFDGREAVEIITNPIDIINDEIRKAKSKYHLTNDNYWLGYLQALQFSITFFDQPPKDDLHS